MKKLVLASAVLAVLAWASNARAETVKLLVSHIHWGGCGGKVAAALGEVPGAKVQGKVAKGTGKDEVAPVTVDLDTSKADVGDLAKAAAGAETPHRGEVGAPSATLVVPAAKDADAKKVQEALAKVKGVDAKASTVEKEAINVKLDDKGGAKLADIQAALKGAGLTK